MNATIVKSALLSACCGLIFAGSAAKTITKTFNVPDGNYKVTAVLGSKKSSGDAWIRAESRRLFYENIHTDKGKFQTVTFTVNKRSPYIDDNGKSIKLKDREKGYANWDSLLTIEFCGSNPQVKDVKIERTDSAITVFLCGNSTVTDQEKEPWASWGQMLPRWFSDKVSVANFAESGERTTSFIASNRWAAVMQLAKAGDYVLIEFGHNDEKDKGAGSGAWYNFSYNLKRMIDEVRKKGCNPVLITPTARRRFQDGKNLNTHGEYPDAVKAIAARENLPLIDLTAMSTTLFETYGEEQSKKFLVHYPANTFPNQPKPLADNTHFNTFGAYEICRCVLQGMKEQNLPLVEYLRQDCMNFNPSQPDDWSKWQWPAGDAETVKPDGN